MNGAFYIGATGLRADERALDVVANNISNLNTTGFKRSDVRFSELVTFTEGSERLPEAAWGAGDLFGVRLRESGKVFEQGELRTTGKAMDVAVNGAGFIELMAPGGQLGLWRGGALTVSDDGYLAGPDGMPLKAMIQVPEGSSDLTIGVDGKVRAIIGDATAPTELGRIELVTLSDTAELKPLADGVYLPEDTAQITARAPGEDGAGLLLQGFVESSNVALSEEMVTMLMLQRAYAANAQLVQAGDQLMSIANNLRR